VVRWQVFCIDPRREDAMRGVIAASLILTLLASAGPASARIVEVTTSVPVEGIAQEGELHRRLQTAVDEALRDTITFLPTLIALTEARVVGERLYLRLLFADAEGERALKELELPEAPGPGPMPFEVPEPDERVWI
jgi:hypothetical protein